MSSVMNPYIVVTYSVSGALTTSSTQEIIMPFAGELVTLSASLGTGNTGADLLVTPSKNATSTLSTTAAGIASIAASGSNWLVTTGTGGHGLSVGQSVVINSATTAANNGTYTVLTVPSATSFTIANANGAAQAAAGGFAWASSAPVLAMPAGGTAGTVYTLNTAAPFGNGINLSGSGSTVTGIANFNTVPAVTPIVSFSAGDKVGFKIAQVGSSAAGSAISASALFIKK
jgi:hypothetical protein